MIMGVAIASRYPNDISHPTSVKQNKNKLKPQVLAGDLEPTTGEVVKSSKNVRVAFLRQEFVDELDPKVHACGRQRTVVACVARAPSGA